MMMRHTVEILAEPNRVWDFVTDPESQKKWMKGLVSNVPLHGEPHTVGSVSRLTVKEGASTVEYLVTLTEVDRPRRLALEMRGGPFRGSPMCVSYRLEDLVGRTRLDYACGVESPSRLMGFVMWLFRGFTRRVSASFMNNLKELCEEPGATA